MYEKILSVMLTVLMVFMVSLAVQAAEKDVYEAKIIKDIKENTSEIINGIKITAGKSKLECGKGNKYWKNFNISLENGASFRKIEVYATNLDGEKAGWLWENIEKKLVWVGEGKSVDCPNSIKNVTKVIVYINVPEISISAPNVIGKKYNGTALLGTAISKQSNVVFKYEISNDGINYSASTVTPSITNAGKLYVKTTASKIGYISKTIEYTLTVNKRNVTLTSASETKIFDSLSLTNNNVVISEDGFIVGQGIERYNVTGSQSAIGTSKNTFTYTLNSNTNADNYEITTVEGDLTVIERVEGTITITVSSDEKNMMACH